MAPAWAAGGPCLPRASSSRTPSALSLLAAVFASLGAAAQPTNSVGSAGQASHVQNRSSRLLLLRRRRTPGDIESQDSSSTLRGSPWEINLWRGTSMAYDFRHLDDLEPVAPMDQLAPGGMSSNAIQEVPGAYRHAQYVPPYVVPDSFPTVAGESCDCEDAGPAPLLPSQLKWARQVADELGVEVDELPAPMPPEGKSTCKCDNRTDAEVYHWAKLEPLPGGNGRKYKVSPADITYGSGDYWHPIIAPGGIVAPEDKMPPETYPIQARADKIHIPNNAHEDKIPIKFARYIDQLESRSIGCDNVSPECTTPCEPGDQVELTMGSLALNATVVSVHLARRVRVEFHPQAVGPEAGGQSAGVCEVASGCTPFRFCLDSKAGAGALCVEPRGSVERGFRGMLRHSLGCPAGTSPCEVVRQDVESSRLKKGGKACSPLSPPA